MAILTSINASELGILNIDPQQAQEQNGVQSSLCLEWSWLSWLTDKLVSVFEACCPKLSEQGTVASATIQIDNMRVNNLIN